MAKRGPITADDILKIRSAVETYLEEFDEAGMEDFSLRTMVANDALRTMEDAGVPLDTFLAGMPRTAADAVKRFGITPQLAREVEIAKEFTGLYVQGFADHMRGVLTQQIVNATRARMDQGELARRLFDTFAGFNRDWRLIAVTETNQNHNNGVLAGVADGEYVVGQSYPDACRWCKENIHGRVMRKVAAPAGPRDRRDWDKEIWVGKSNFGRSQHPLDRTGRVRKDHELWKPAPIGHPGCRCYWEPFFPDVQYVNKEGFVRLKATR